MTALGEPRTKALSSLRMTQFWSAVYWSFSSEKSQFGQIFTAAENIVRRYTFQIFGKNDVGQIFTIQKNSILYLRDAVGKTEVCQTGTAAESAGIDGEKRVGKRNEG